MIKKVSHIGIAVNSIEQASRLYTEVLGLKIAGIEIVPDQKVKIAMIPVGDTIIELLEPTDPAGAVGKHIASRGEGLHHLALEVDDIAASLELMQQKDVPLVDQAPRVGGHHSLIAFLHPKATKALIELTQPAK